MKTQIIQGPTTEYARAMSTRRFLFGLLRDPIVHLYRATFMTTHRETAPRTLCGQTVAFGRHEPPADATNCWRCARVARISERQRTIGF